MPLRARGYFAGYRQCLQAVVRNIAQAMRESPQLVGAPEADKLTNQSVRTERRMGTTIAAAH